MRVGAQIGRHHRRGTPQIGPRRGRHPRVTQWQQRLVPHLLLRPEPVQGADLSLRRIPLPLQPAGQALPGGLAEGPAGLRRRRELPPSRTRERVGHGSNAMPAAAGGRSPGWCGEVGRLLGSGLCGPARSRTLRRDRRRRTRRAPADRRPWPPLDRRAASAGRDGPEPPHGVSGAHPCRARRAWILARRRTTSRISISDSFPPPTAGRWRDTTRLRRRF